MFLTLILKLSFFQIKCKKKIVMIFFAIMTRISYHREKQPIAETSYVGNANTEAKGKHINRRKFMLNSTKSIRFSVTYQNNNIVKAKRPYFNPLETDYDPADEDYCVEFIDGVCQRCESGYYNYEGTCIDDCDQNGQYPTFVDGNDCKDCDPSCQSCNGDGPDDCLTCISGLYFYNRMCNLECPSNTYKSDQECIDCNYPCKTCEENADKCTSCEDGYYLDTNNACHSCNESCLTCSGPNTCLSCKSPNYLQGDKCVTICNTGYFQNNNNRKCEKCMDNCSMCNSNTCIECNKNYKLDGNHGCVKIDETVDVENVNYVRKFQQLSLKLLISFGVTDDLII